MLTTIDRLVGNIIAYSLLAPTTYVNLIYTNSVAHVPGFQIVIEEMAERPRSAASLNLQKKLDMLEGFLVSVNQAVHQQRPKANLYAFVRADQLEQIRYEAVS
jgi:hypothetical protein